MKAIQLVNYGGPELLTIKEIPLPVCKPDEVLVRVEAVGLNYVDTLIRKGRHPILKQFPAVMPGEVEGIIEDAGKEVRHLYPGQRITGYAQAGYAQFAVIPASEVTLLPEELPLGTGMLIHHLTAQNLLHQSDGYDSLLITAAAGGVGSSVIRIAGLKGVGTIIGMAGSADKAGYVSSLGATSTVIYTAGNWLDQLDALVEKKGIDLILDSVGGHVGAALLSRLARGGTMVVYGNSSGQPSIVDMSGLIMSNTRIVSARLYSAPLTLREQWTKEIIQWIRSGQLDVKITSYPLVDAARAHQDMEERRSIGRLILQTW
ncbi:MAG: zinc-binding dehydrogenase [Chitinophagaceae bacterium]|nr:zinc-binding dehydrogenase [Chitinophagaceae bacterium]